MHMPKIENAKAILENLCHGRFQELYGSNAPDAFRERLHAELEIILEHSQEIPYLLARHIVEESVRKGYPTSTRGAVGSSLAAFLLGITGINPLQAHYHCPQCKGVALMADIADGYDLPDKSCSVCGATMKGDGHRIPFVSFSGYHGSKAPDMVINVAPAVQRISGEILRSLFPKDKVVLAGTKTEDGSMGVFHPGGYFIIPAEYADKVPTVHVETDHGKVEITGQDFYHLTDDFLKMDLLGHPVPEMLAWLSEETGMALDGIPMNDPAVLGLIQAGRTDGIPEFGSDFSKSMLALCKPACFSDLCKISGLSHGTGVWIENAQRLLQNGAATLKDVLAFREDIYDSLIQADVDCHEAYRIMESVRSGLACREVDELDFADYDLPAWFYPSIRKIKYMFPKAHGVSYVRMAMQMAWFRQYHAGLFGEVWKKHKAD